MQLLDNLIIITLIALAFFAGKRTADSYNSETIEWLLYIIRLNAAEKGVGYVAAPEKPQQHRRNRIGIDFIDKMMREGHATQKL